MKKRQAYFLLTSLATLLPGSGLAQTNLFENPSFENFSVPLFGAGKFTDGWQASGNNAAIYSIDGGFGVPTSYQGHFTGVNPTQGNRFAGAATNATISTVFGQQIDKTMKIGDSFRIEGWFRRSQSPTFLGTGGFKAYALTDWNDTRPKEIAIFDGFKNNTWAQRYVIFKHLSKGTNPVIAFLPFSTNGQTMVGATDQLALYKATAVIEGLLAAPGITSFPQGYEIEITLFPSNSNGDPEEIFSSVGNSGTFSTIAASPTGTYNVEVRAPKALTVLLQSKTLDSAGIDLGKINLTMGDLNGDNYIGSDDYLILNNSFDKAVGDPGYDPRADINGDEYVGTDDYLIINQNFDKTGD